MYLQIISRQQQRSRKSDSKRRYLTYTVKTNTLFADITNIFNHQPATEPGIRCCVTKASVINLHTNILPQHPNMN
jgi:hypothetical protein